MPVRDRENAALADVQRSEAEIRHDEAIGLVAVVFLMASFAMFSFAARHPSAVRGQQLNPHSLLDCLGEFLLPSFLDTQGEVVGQTD